MRRGWQVEEEAWVREEIDAALATVRTGPG